MARPFDYRLFTRYRPQRRKTAYKGDFKVIAQEALAPFKVAKIRPQLVSRGKITDKLLRTDKLGVTIQVIAPNDGETNLHAHPGVDGA